MPLFSSRWPWSACESTCVRLHSLARLCPALPHRRGTTGEESASFIPGPPEPEQPRPSIHLLAGAVPSGPHFPARALWREGKHLLRAKAFRARAGLGNMTLNPAKGFIYSGTSHTLQVFPANMTSEPLFSWSLFGGTCLLRQLGWSRSRRSFSKA